MHFIELHKQKKYIKELYCCTIDHFCRFCFLCFSTNVDVLLLQTYHPEFQINKRFPPIRFVSLEILGKKKPQKLGNNSNAQKYRYLSEFPLECNSNLHSQNMILYQSNKKKNSISQHGNISMSLLTLSAWQTKTDTCANGVDPDETAHNELSHQDLHCLLFLFYIRLKPLFASVDMSKF